MKITSIEKAKGNRYTIYVDGEYWYILDAEIILQNSLKTGRDVDPKLLEELKEQAERRKARERAYYLLGYRDHSAKELYDKLLHSVSPETAAETVALMIEQGYINDAAYAEKLARYFLQSKKWGGRRALQEMVRRGIDRETAENALADCEVDTSGQIKAILEKKYASLLANAEDDRKANQKVTAALLRLGYDYSDIRQVLAEYQEEKEEDWE